MNIYGFSNGIYTRNNALKLSERTKAVIESLEKKCPCFDAMKNLDISK